MRRVALFLFVSLVGVWFTGCQTSQPFKQAPGAFAKACAEGNLDVVKAWKNPPLNEQDASETTPLDYAVLNGDLAMAEFLLQKGADPNGVLLTDCICLRSALAEAYRQNNPAMIALLKKYGADLNHRDTDGNTDLHRGAHQFDCETFKRLFAAGLDVKAVNNEGCTVFFCLPSTNQMSTDEMGALVKLFQQYGADINQPAYNGLTPFQAAYLEGDIEKAKVFQANGAKVNAPRSHPTAG